MLFNNYNNIFNHNLIIEEYLENKYENNEINNEDNYNEKDIYGDNLKDVVIRIEEVKTGITLNNLNKKDINLNSKDNFDKSNKNKKILKEGKKIGRKKKNSNEKGEHNKLCQDNI